jgi:hypothetical protein
MIFTLDPLQDTCGLTPIELLFAGGYGYIEPKIVHLVAHFDLSSTRPSKELFLVRFKTATSSDNILRQLSGILEPASLHELLLLGGSFPKLQMEHPIIALGTRVRQGKIKLVPCLSYGFGKRHLKLNRYDGRWANYCSFACRNMI